MLLGSLNTLASLAPVWSALALSAMKGTRASYMGLAHLFFWVTAARRAEASKATVLHLG